MTELYHPVEQAILCDWLGAPRPPAARGIAIDHPRALRNLKSVFPDAIRPQPQADGRFGPHTLANAVARLATSAIPIRLKRGASSLAPILLLEIDWDAPESLSFQPEAYHLSYLPGFGVKVVTASRESPQAYGYHSVAVGVFAGDVPALRGAGEVVRSWWRRLAEVEGRGRWDAVLAAGEVSDREAERWADLVWGAPEVAAIREPVGHASGD